MNITIRMLWHIVSFLLFAGIVLSTIGGDIVLVSKVVGQSAQPRKYVVNDYDGDGISDLAIYNESQGLVSIYSLTNGLLCNDVQFGGPGWMPFPGDFNGDFYCDLAMYNYTSGDWYILINLTWEIMAGQLGGRGYIPAIADYDGDGVSDVGVYNVFTARWYVCSLANGVLYWDIPFGEPYPDPQFDPHLDYPSIPIAADFDGDGKADLALYINKFSNSGFYTFPIGWIVLYSRTKTAGYIVSQYESWYRWGLDTILFDDNGDGVFELGTDSYVASIGPVVLTGDYNGDGKREKAKYTQYEGWWHVYLYTNYGQSLSGQFGNASFYPITEICSREDKCIWDNSLEYIILYGDYGNDQASLTIYKNKVTASFREPEIGHTEVYGGGIIGNEIWLLNMHDVFNPNNISRGSISHNPIIIYDYLKGQKTGIYWEFYR